jgi:AraC-like DNA-binding protein
MGNDATVDAEPVAKCAILSKMKAMPPAKKPSIAKPKSKQGRVPMAFVGAILRAYKKYGVDPTAALEVARIPPHTTKDSNTGVTATQFEALSWAAMRELDDEALGWFSRKLPWGAYGMLCRASITSATIEVALRRWGRHHRILTDEVALNLSVSNGVACLSIDECSDLGAFREFCLVTLLRYVYGFACWAIDTKIELLHSEFSYPAPTHAAIYPTIFSENLRFNADRTRIFFSSRYLAMPLRRDEPALNKMLKRALPLTVLPYRKDELLVSRVLQLLRMSGSSFPLAEDLAEALNLSTRSLQRKLEKEGAPLRQLKERARVERARRELARNNRAIKLVAFSVGFRNEKSFSRAFRRWTGQTPSDFRGRMKLAVEEVGAPENVKG